MERFVGRTRELGSLRALLDEAVAGAGRLVLLAGEPGIGKTRTADELASIAAGNGSMVCWGRCREDPGAPALWPWQQILRACGGVLDPRQPDPTTDRFWLFDSVARFLRATAERQSLVVVLDDLHWADTPSLRLLEFLAGELVSTRMLVLATYRDTDLHWAHPLRRTLVELARHRGTRRLALRGWGVREIGQFVRAGAGLDLPAGAAARLHRETDGNPFFVTEVVRVLAAEDRLGELVAVDGRDERRVPETVREAIAIRLERLPPGGVELLRAAAIFGREFEIVSLAEILRREQQAILDALHAAEAARIVDQVTGPVGRYRFVHALVREALYDLLGPAMRVQLHREAGLALERLWGADPGDRVSELAHHFLQAAPAGEARRALEYSVAAARRASLLLAHEEAARHYRTALVAQRLTAAAADERRCELLLELGGAHARAGDTTQAEQAITEAAQLARRLDDPAWFARAALLAGEVRVRVGMVDPACVALLEEAEARLGDEDGELRARVLGRLAMELYYGPEHERRLAASAEAVAVARRLCDPGTLAVALNARRFASWTADNLDERLRVDDELLRLAREANDAERTLQAYRWRIQDRLDAGDRAGFDRDLQTFTALAEELRHPLHRWYATVFAATQALRDGRLSDSERLADAALSVGRRVQPLAAVLYHGAQMRELRRLQGRLGEVEADLIVADEQFPLLRFLSYQRILFAAELGRVDEARTRLETAAASGFTDLPHHMLRLGCLAVLAEACTALGDAAQAETLTRLLTPYAGRHVTLGIPAYYGAVTYYLGLLASTRSRFDEAARLFANALALHEHMGARPFSALTRTAWARALLAAGAPGCRREAAALLARALAEATELGMPALVRRVREEAASARLQLGRRALRRNDGLTPREVDVLELLATGRSNKEIAGAMFLTVNTVERHLANIYRKTGVKGRAAATAYALRQGLA